MGEGNRELGELGEFFLRNRGGAERDAELLGRWRREGAPWDRRRPAGHEVPMNRAKPNMERGFPSRTAHEKPMRERDAS